MPAVESRSHLDYAFYRVHPRPDQPERHDQQTAFLNSEKPGLTVLLGGNGSGKSVFAILKMVTFLLHGAPPLQRDFPFWIISNTFQQVLDVCWKEKLHNFGLLPPQFIDHARIRWFDRKSDWPYAVPLIDHKDSPGKNWVIEFRSQDQQLDSFAGTSIGGFLFTEPFHYEYLQEVMMRCRVYGGVGNKLAEMCPTNPDKCFWLQQMDEADDIPDSWGLYYTNTECAVESGHFNAQLFKDAFAIIPDAMKQTRLKGLWANYVGLVYPEFNPMIHCIPEKTWDIPPACHHRRTIDWGSGPENPFCCLWMYRNGKGQWTVYDEYYSTDPISPVAHLQNVHDRHPWPNNPYYGVTWADPSDPGNLRIAARLPDYSPGYESINIQPANHDRIEGRSHVRWLLDSHVSLSDEFGKPQPMLFIVKERCPNLIREFRTHRYLQSSGVGLNPRLAKPEVLEKDNHALDALRYCVFTEHKQTGTTPQVIMRERNIPRSMQFESKKFRRGGDS